MPAKARKPSLNAAALARQAATETLLFGGEESPFHAAVSRGAGKLVVVTGENASGKSLFVRAAAALLQQDGSSALPVSVSIRERTGAGSFEMGGLRRVMMFGDEQEQSTGATSVGAVKTAFNNLGRPEGSLLILDEPELGLSESYAGALGEYIGRQALEMPRACLGIIVATHSRPLVRGLAAGFGKLPAHAAVSAGTPARAGLAQWLEAGERHTVEDLLALQDIALDRWRRTNKLLSGP